MCREIKFRAFYKGNKYPLDPNDLEDYEKPQMVYDIQNLYDGKGCIDENSVLGGRSSFGSLLDDEDFILMQFTGLKDKNGKEIYEGDIVEHGMAKIKSKVVFIDGSFSFNSINAIVNTCIRHYGLDECEIIGNIYENPELLNQ